jgi:hypothetical protein
VISASAILAVIALSAAASAAPADERGGLRAACTADAKKFCNNVSPGQGRLRGCMQAHLKELSPACRERIEQLPKAKS